MLDGNNFPNTIEETLIGGKWHKQISFKLFVLSVIK